MNDPIGAFDQTPQTHHHPPEVGDGVMTISGCGDKWGEEIEEL
jgi:hypothetical protein